jgi:hypothetical protein
VTRWTEADVAALRARQQNPNWSVGQTTKAHKYHAQGQTVDGIHFASKLEARCYELQKLRVAAKELKFFLRQTPFHLPGGVTYRCDFFCVFTHGGIEVIDAKGVDTQEGRNKRKQVKELYGVEVILWTDNRRLGYRRPG